MHNVLCYNDSHGNIGNATNDYHNLSSTRRWDSYMNEYLDLVDEMQWEDLTDFLTLEEAGLENQDFDTVPAAQDGYYVDEGEI